MVRAPAPLRHPLRPDEILAAACRAIVDRGLAETRISDIANLAGTSTGTIHYYFETKRDVLQAALEWAVERLIARMRGRPSAEEDALTRLARLLENSVPETDHDDYALWIEMWALVLRAPEHLASLQPLSERWRQLFFDVVLDGTLAGEFDPIAPPDQVAERLIALAGSLGFDTVVGYSWSSPARMRALLVSFAAEQLRIDADRLQDLMADSWIQR